MLLRIERTGDADTTANGIEGCLSLIAGHGNTNLHILGLAIAVLDRILHFERKERFMTFLVLFHFGCTADDTAALNFAFDHN